MFLIYELNNTAAFSCYQDLKYINTYPASTDLSCPHVFLGDMRDLCLHGSEHKVVCAQNLMSDPRLLYKQMSINFVETEGTD